MTNSFMKEDDYLDILNSNDQDLMKEFLLSNGKKQKPISPIFYINKEEDGNEKPRVNG